ncbi:hypothetical protein [Pedobacter steynii]|nr:hypothetical protein [Pedobacter steynii]
MLLALHNFISHLLSNENWIMPVIFLGFSLVLLISLTVDFFWKKGFSIFFLLLFYILGFFLKNDMLWAARLLWNKNHLLIFFCTLLFLALVSAVLYRLYHSDNVWTKHYQNKPKTSAQKSWKEESIFIKIVTLPFFGLLIYFMASVPFNAVSVAGYLACNQEVKKTAGITNKGAVRGSGRGSGFYHRYWTIDIDNREERFWIYAAVNTETSKGLPCSAHDPEVGSTLLINGREGLFGFAYDQVVEIKSPDHRIYCEGR